MPPVCWRALRYEPIAPNAAGCAASGRPSTRTRVSDSTSQLIHRVRICAPTFAAPFTMSSLSMAFPRVGRLTATEPGSGSLSSCSQGNRGRHRQSSRRECSMPITSTVCFTSSWRCSAPDDTLAL
jgi:hypothetical protein